MQKKKNFWLWNSRLRSILRQFLYLYISIKSKGGYSSKIAIDGKLFFPPCTECYLEVHWRNREICRDAVLLSLCFISRLNISTNVASEKSSFWKVEREGERLHVGFDVAKVEKLKLSRAKIARPGGTQFREACRDAIPVKNRGRERQCLTASPWH